MLLHTNASTAQSVYNTSDTPLQVNSAVTYGMKVGTAAAAAFGGKWLGAI